MHRHAHAHVPNGTIVSWLVFLGVSSEDTSVMLTLSVLTFETVSSLSLEGHTLHRQSPATLNRKIVRLSVMAHVQPFTSELDDKVRNIRFIVGVFSVSGSSSEESSLSCLFLQR